MSEKFKLNNTNNTVSVTDNDANAVLFSVECENEEDSKYLENELYNIIYLLNEQNKVLKKEGYTIP